MSTHDKLSFRDNDEGDVRCLYLGSVCFTLSSLFMHFLSLPKRYHQNLKGMDIIPPLGRSDLSECFQQIRRDFISNLKDLVSSRGWGSLTHFQPSSRLFVHFLTVQALLI